MFAFLKLACFKFSNCNINKLLLDKTEMVTEFIDILQQHLSDSSNSVVFESLYVFPYALSLTLISALEDLS
jgi:hypothetical protein